MEEKIERISEWIKRKSFPFTIELNLTNLCNLKCKMCWLRSSNPNLNELKDEVWLRIVEEAVEVKIKEFRIPGSGEPLMRKDLVFKLMEKIKEEGRNGLLISNGTLFTEKDVRKLVEIEWDVLTLSIDGPNPKINDFIRGKNTFQKVIKTLKWLKKWKRKLKTQTPWLRMNVVLTNKNYDKLDKMIKLAKNYEFKEVLLQPITIFSKEGEKLSLKNSNIDKFLLKGIELAKKFKIKTNFKLFLKNKIIKMTNEMEKLIENEIRKFKGFLAIPCYEPFYNLIISPSGNIKVCAVANESNLNVKNKSIKQIWFSEYLMQARKNLKEHKLFPFCSHCCVPIFLENKRIRTKLVRFNAV
jgi:MoaA/NifB/PqqE/SkfB family radical SAM enzyme